MAKRSRSKKDVLLKVDADLAKELQEISDQTHSSMRDVLAAFTWIGKRALGRTVVIDSKDENRSLKITALESYSKITSIEDTE